jgi:hypothetical protein
LNVSAHLSAQKLAEHYLGLRLFDSGSGELVRFGVIQISPNGQTQITYIGKQDFFLQAAGMQTSKGNKEKINYWKTYKVDARTVDKLWKIKYMEYPYERREDKEGWANLRYAPSAGQFEFLKKYGFTKTVSDFIYGEKCFQLLHDMQSPEWQYEYSTL